MKKLIITAGCLALLGSSLCINCQGSREGSPRRDEKKLAGSFTTAAVVGYSSSDTSQPGSGRGHRPDVEAGQSQRDQLVGGQYGGSTGDLDREGQIEQILQAGLEASKQLGNRPSSR